MDIRVFTLCDGAFNYNGKLTIVGTVDHIKVPKVPVIARIALAVKIANVGGGGAKTNITINFKTLQGENLAPEIVFEAETKEQIVIAGNIDGLNIKELGDCFVELKVGEQLFTLPFKVVK